MAKAFTKAVIESRMRELARARAPKSICPSEVARSLAGDAFRPLMDDVRAVAAKLVKRGEVVVTQKGNVVDPVGARGPIRITAALGKTKVSYIDAYRGVDFRKHPEKYRVGRGEEGVLVAEPYKSELLPLWRFRTPEIAEKSATALWKAFVGYRRDGDFVGMDLARKFIQMGYTRARRYGRHASGRKYDAHGKELPEVVDDVKNASAAVFRVVWDRVEADKTYARLLEEALAREKVARRLAKARD